MPTPEDWRVLSVSHESQGLRMVGVREGILEISSKKKKVRKLFQKKEDWMNLVREKQQMSPEGELLG